MDCFQSLLDFATSTHREDAQKVPGRGLQGFPGGSAVKNLPDNAGDTALSWVWSLGWEDPLEEEMLTHSCLENLMDKQPGGLQSMGSQGVRCNWSLAHALCLQLQHPSLGR